MLTHQHTRKKQAYLIRIFRKIHRTTGALLFVFFFIVAVTGLLLGWKKHSNGIILAETRKGTSTDFKNWLTIDSLTKCATFILHDSISPQLNPSPERIDIRKEQGVIKFTYEDGFWGIQLDGATGKLLHIERRRSDFIEKIHDGSILDLYFNTGSGQIKLAYTTILGVALLIFTTTGFWLWYGPIRMRRSQRNNIYN